MKPENNVKKLTMLKVSQCVEAINGAQYYLHIWKNVSHTKPLNECTRNELLKPFQDFWEKLPDKQEIRGYPFFLICDLAEEYLMGDEDDQSYLDE